MKIDLRERLPAARDQLRRPTCLSHAVSDSHLAARAEMELLSPDYLHYHANRLGGFEVNEAARTDNVLDALLEFGQPREADCPYSGMSRGSGWEPPRASAIWRRNTYFPVGTPSSILTAALNACRLDVVTLTLSRSFFEPDPVTHAVREDGTQMNRHAVVVVGMRSDAFLVRNSWGCSWGDNGHGWLEFAYVDSRAVEVIEMREEVEDADN